MAVQGAVPKQPAETFPVGLDFKRYLGVGETLVTPTTTSKNLGTGADSTATFLQGSSAVVGSIVTHRIIAGTDGDRHRVQIKVTTSAGNTFEDEIDVPVKAF